MDQVRCPRCAGEEVLPVVYGYPNEEMRRQAAQDRLVLGGCIVNDDSPAYLCTRCSNRWSDIWSSEADDEDEDLDPEDEFAAAVRSGAGGEHPPVSEEWNEHLAGLAANLFTDGSGARWARYVWAALAASGLTRIDTELDRVRAGVRLAALDVLRSIFLARALDDADDPSWRIEEHELIGDPPRIDPFLLGVLAAMEGVADTDMEVGCYAEDSAAQDALTELVRAEVPAVAAALREALGTSRLVASMWASSIDDARYPLNRDAMDVLLNHDLTGTKHRVFAWVDEGMPV